MLNVVLFGTFDRLHPGHAHILAEANRLGAVTVILAQDAVVRRLKGHEPQFSYKDREQALLTHPHVFSVFPSDLQEGEYRVLRSLSPDIVAFGHDQHALSADFHHWMQRVGYHVRTVTLSPFHPEIYSSSKLRSSHP